MALEKKEIVKKIKPKSVILAERMKGSVFDYFSS